MSNFPSAHYERVLSTEDEEEELSELPPTYVTTRGPEKTSTHYNIHIIIIYNNTIQQNEVNNLRDLIPSFILSVYLSLLTKYLLF